MRNNGKKIKCFTTPEEIKREFFDEIFNNIDVSVSFGEFKETEINQFREDLGKFLGIGNKYCQIANSKRFQYDEAPVERFEECFNEFTRQYKDIIECLCKDNIAHKHNVFINRRGIKNRPLYLNFIKSNNVVEYKYEIINNLIYIYRARRINNMLDLSNSEAIRYVYRQKNKRNTNEVENRDIFMEMTDKSKIEEIYKLILRNPCINITKILRYHPVRSIKNILKEFNKNKIGYAKFDYYIMFCYSVYLLKHGNREESEKIYKKSLKLFDERKLLVKLPKEKGGKRQKNPTIGINDYIIK